MPYIGTTPTKVVSRQSANVYRYTATAGQSVFTGADLDNNVLACNPADMIVHMNGLRLESTDYTATSASVTLTTAATAGDEVTVTSFVTFEVADTYTKTAADSRYVNTTGDTMTGNLTIADGTNAMHIEVRNGTNWTGRFAAPAVGKSAIQYFNGLSWANGVEVDSAGRVTMPYQPAFYVTGSYSVTSLVFNSFANVVTNNGGHFNNSTGAFTAPVAGIYQFNLGFLGARNTNTYTVFAPYKNGLNAMSGWIQSYTYSQTNDNWHGATFILNMSVNDTLDVRANSSYENTYLSGYNTFSGHLIG